jgi:hypothetical protein
LPGSYKTFCNGAGALSSAEALIGYEGAKSLHDATPNMAVNRGGRIIIKRKIQVKMTEKISLTILQQADKEIVYQLYHYYEIRKCYVQFARKHLLFF